MDRAEATGLGIAAAGHVALFAALSLGLLAVPRALTPIHDPVEVQLVDEIGSRSAQPTPAVAEPAPSAAPEVGPPEEAAAPQPAIARAVEFQPAPSPQPSATKPTPAKPAPAAAETNAKARPRGARLGPNFLKGLSDKLSASTDQTPRAATVDTRAMASLAAAIARQVEPCLAWPDAGADLSTIVTVLNVRFNKDGTIASQPRVVDQTGITEANRAYAAQMGDAAKRSVIRCTPLKLPAELYENGWNNIEFGLRKRG